MEWVPEAAKTYLAHTVQGISLRELARDKGCAPSTILRQVRKYELRRDDPLVDEALDALTANYPQLEFEFMPNSNVTPIKLTEEKIAREARRILRRLCENGTFLLVATAADQAIVFKEVVPGRQTKLAAVERVVANAFALNEWIAGTSLGKVNKYHITSMGRTALKRLIAEDKLERDAVNSPFQEQHKEFGERVVMAANGSGKETLRYNLAESPLTLLARKKDKTGEVFLTPELLEAGERLREDFERAHIGPRVAQNWDRFLTAGGTPAWSAGSEGSSAARDRVAEAVRALGPGLADIALRVCCYLDGLEKAERRLGWSARSGKIVLKIALQRLACHYDIQMPAEQKAS